MAGLTTMYLNELGHSLHVNSRLKKRILFEIEDHLQESIQHYQEHGLPIEVAEQQVIASFGSPWEVAQQFATGLAAESVDTASRALLPIVICLQLVTQFGYHYLPLASRPRSVMAGGFLAWMINLYSYAFLAALAACLYALWWAYRYSRQTTSLREIHYIVGVLTLALAALTVAGITTILFVIRLPGSPSSLVQAGIAGSAILIVLIGGAFILRVVTRYVALQATKRGASCVDFRI